MLLMKKEADGHCENKHDIREAPRQVHREVSRHRLDDGLAVTANNNNMNCLVCDSSLPCN